MTYLALTQGTAEWLLPKVGLTDVLLQALLLLSNSREEWDKRVFAEGPIRISVSDDQMVVALWHIDYSSGSGDEAWGFIRMTGDTSIEKVPVISKEVFERSIYVVSQRLQGLMIDGAFFHRKYENGAHTLLAGRGALARQYSIGYFETALEDDGDALRSIVNVGPSDSFSALSSAAEKAGRESRRLVSVANTLLSGVRGKAPISSASYKELRERISSFSNASRRTDSEFDNVQVEAGNGEIESFDALKCVGYTYDQWLDPDSPLNEIQRRVLHSDPLEQHPLRILGPGGSGKTLLMQLLAVKKLYQCRSRDSLCRILYVVHSNAMREKVIQKFQLLTGGGVSFEQKNGEAIIVSTLSEYCRNQLTLDVDSVLDTDADDAKAFQCAQVLESLKEAQQALPNIVGNSRLLSEIFKHENLVEIFARLVVAEISVAIKGHGLEADMKRYVQSERSLSRLHGVLGQSEREFVFQVFKNYHRVIFEEFGVLDPDDIALSLSGRLNTPLWKLRRREQGFDYVFVDEAQLFNENERRVLPFLTRGTSAHVPIALALDQAQSIYGETTAGLATIGIKDVENEKLDSIHRSTAAIVRLAFFVIQRSTDLFGPEFPDFTRMARSMLSDSHPLAAIPVVEKEGAASRNLGKFVLRRIRDLRRGNLRQIAVVCHADTYWQNLEQELSASDLPFQIMRERGERVSQDQPLVALCKPAQVGGQEFDAVIVVGLEFGVTPPRDIDNAALSAAVEQQVIREMYLTITRARYRVIFALSQGSSPNQLLKAAIDEGLVQSA